MTIFSTRRFIFSTLVLVGLSVMGMQCPQVATLQVSTTSLDFAESETLKTFELWNSGPAGTMVNATITTDQTWLTVTPDTAASTGADDRKTITVNANPPSVPATGNITIASDGGNQTIAVTVAGAMEGVGEEVLSEFSLIVEVSLTPRSDPLPAPDGVSPDRPVATIVDETGRQADFVENELIVGTDDMTTLNDFIARWGGELILTFDSTRSGLGLPMQHLVRIDTTLADSTALVADILTLDPNSRGASSVSSEAGMHLLAAGASEAAAGMAVGVNWIAIGSDIQSRSALESTTGPNGFNSAGGGYSRNAFNWNHLDAGSTQDIGVTEAWVLLAETGRISNTVKIAILDMGFDPTTNGDFPPGFSSISNVPGFSAIGTANLANCGGPCLWHGTSVVNAAMAVVDNGIGGAGPAGPVAELLVVFTLYDFFTGMFAVEEAVFSGARIINMSYGATIPAAFSWSALPFEAVTGAARLTGTLLFAAAGNDNENVDSRDCFLGICWEGALHTPCENAGVICVGGIGLNSINKAGGSNFGPTGVHIYAPYTVIVGTNPASAPGARSASGTSFSSPYTAGVAALIWAADPTLSASQVESILFSTAHTSPDANVNRYVDAHAAVELALGSLIIIQDPIDGISVAGGTSLTFNAFVAEGGRGTATVTWSSSIDGAIGTGLSFFLNDLSTGVHNITATATFGDSFVTTDNIGVTITNDPPIVTITSPTDGASFFMAQPVGLAGTSFDTNNPPTFDLPPSALTWFLDGNPIGTGLTQTITGGTLSLGGHTIRFEGTDGIATAMDSVSITINVDPVDLPPNVVNINNPAQSDSFLADTLDGRGWFINITLQGNASDIEDGTLTGTSLEWSTNINGGAPEILGTGTSLSANLYAPNCFGNSHDITLTATDSDANETTMTIRINVSQFCR